MAPAPTLPLARLRPLHWLLLFGALLMAVQVLWIAGDRGIGPPPDSEHHLLLSQLYARALQLEGASGLWDTLRHTPTLWPPLTYLFHGGLAALVGLEHRTVRALAVLLVPLLLWGVYRLGRALGGGPLSATLAALLTVWSIGVVGQMRQVALDFGAITTVVWSLSALLSTRGFTRLGASLWFGASVGLCLLGRTQALFFLTGPALLVIGETLWRGPSWAERARKLGRMVAGLGPLALVSAPWWAGRLGTFWSHVRDHVDTEETPVWGDPTLWGGVKQYVLDLGRTSVWLPLVLALALLPLLLRRGRARSAALLLAWVGGSVLFYASTVSRHPHYILPALPGLLLIVALGLGRLRLRLGAPLGALLLALVCGTTLAQSVYRDDGSSDLVWQLSQSGLGSYSYVRAPHVTTPAMRLAARLHPILDPLLEGAGGKAYLLYVHDPRYCLLPRVVVHLMVRYPGLLYSDNWRSFAVSPLHRRWRRRGPMLLLSAQKKPGMKLVWSGEVNEENVDVFYYLYQVPKGHKVLEQGMDDQQTEH